MRNCFCGCGNTRSGHRFCSLCRKDSGGANASKIHSNHFQFSKKPVVELIHSEEDRDKARLVAENIDLLFRHASNKEKNMPSWERETSTVEGQIQSASSLHQQYIETKQSVLDAITTDTSDKGIRGFSVTNESDDLQLHLAATSWAVFLCLDDPKLEARYRLRALDWDNLVERLK